MVTRMRVLSFVLCFVVSFAVGSAAAASESLNDLKLTILDISRSGTVTVSMINSSQQKALKVWRESNSWGAYRWRVLFIRRGQVRTIFEDPDGVGFTRNIPTSDEIAIGSHIDRQLNVNGEEWSKAGSDEIQFEPGDQVIVIYDVPPEDEAKKMHVWYGVAATSATVK
jgi:hypothetical protein